MSGVRVSVERPRWRITLGGVQLPLIVLKLVGVITWPWSLVLLPLWFGLGALFIGLGIAVAIGWQRVTQLVQDRGSGEPAALLVPNRTQD
jgi:hypothetical protein